MLKERLQISIITYNRCDYLARTLECFFADNSPIKDFDLLVLDNNSTDKTEEIVQEFQKKHPNLTYIKNNKNVGANANIVKAFEYNKKDYLWVVADDDVYDWKNWTELEQAIENDEKVLVISRMDLPEEYKNNPAKILHQCAFVSGFICHHSLIDDTVMRNMYDNVYCMFPHLIPLVTHINNGGTFYVLNQGLIKHGSYENKSSEDMKQEDIFARGAKLEKLWRKSRTMQFETGFAIALSNLKNEKLKQTAIKLQMETQVWQKGLQKQRDVLQRYTKFYNNPKYLTQLIDLYLNVDPKNAAFLRHHIIKVLGSSLGFHEIIVISIRVLKKNIKYLFYSFAKLVSFGALRKKYQKKQEKYR